MPRPIGTAMTMRDERGDQGAVDGRQGAEILGDRIPGLGGQEAEAELRQRRRGAVDQRKDHAAEQQQHRDRAGLGQDAEGVVAEFEPAQDLVRESPLTSLVSPRELNEASAMPHLKP